MFHTVLFRKPLKLGFLDDSGFIDDTKVNMAETDVTRMSSDYADNELELFRKTVSAPRARVCVCTVCCFRVSGCFSCVSMVQRNTIRMVSLVFQDMLSIVIITSGPEPDG